MARLVLVANKVDAIEPPKEGQVTYHDAIVPGFGLRVASTGGKAWVVMKRLKVGGKSKPVRITFAHYPATKLAAAREKARELLETMEGGEDPREVEAERLRQEAEQAQVVAKAAENTYGKVRDKFLTFKTETLKPRTIIEYRRVLSGAEFSTWEDRPIAEIDEHDVIDALEAIEERTSGVTANRAHAYLSSMFRWAMRSKRLIKVVPTDLVAPPDDSESRGRVLDEDELRLIWTAAASHGGVLTPVYQLLILTGQRRNEVAGLQWDEVKGLETTEPLIDLPPERTKNGQPHLVPLPAMAADILREIKKQRRNSPFVFTTTETSAVSGFSRVKKRIEKEVSRLRFEAVAEAEKLVDGDYKRDLLERFHRLFAQDWRVHDFRRTLVTGLNERVVTGTDPATGKEKKGVAPHIVEAIVNHIGAAKAGVAGVYNRALYLDEKRAALELWADYIKGVVAVRAPLPVAPAPVAAEVVDFTAARASKRRK